jgi:hypothetical protein
VPIKVWFIIFNSLECHLLFSFKNRHETPPLTSNFQVIFYNMLFSYYIASHINTYHSKLRCPLILKNSATIFFLSIQNHLRILIHMKNKYGSY